MNKPLAWKPQPPHLLRGSHKKHRSLVCGSKVQPDEGQRISHDTRLFVWTRDGGRCRNCGSTKNLHFDHIIPRVWGGGGTAENVELLCRDCNLKKGAHLSAPGNHA